ncbi:eukaryotic translation initiation factor 4 gamma 2-like [Apostichopus japonicus]|uniref:eukaryotic translation initiation factor 4 gamma 2-like n=1 Tax=Stichopus japonicus TaxID=307972 RepID=UPI003AB244A3
MYAQLCRRLDKDAPNFEPEGSKNCTFRRLLISKCQDEFENRSRAFAAFDTKNGPLSDEEEDARHLAKHKMLGNITFIGELFKLEMLHVSIVHKCIKQLLEKKSSDKITEKGEDLECLCKIMNSVGVQLDHDKARTWMDQYFERMFRYSDNMMLSSRIRFMLQDCCELRRNKWVQARRVTVEKGPQTISQVHQDAAKEMTYTKKPNRNPQADFFGQVNDRGGVQNPSMWTMTGLNEFYQENPSTSYSTGPSFFDDEPNPRAMAYRQFQSRDQPYQNQYNNQDNRQNQGFNNYNNKNNTNKTSAPRFQQTRGNMGGQQGNQYNQQQQYQGNSDGGGGSQQGSYQQNRNPVNQAGQNQGGQGNTYRPPRFNKMNTEQLNLRPNTNNPILKPQGPGSLPPSAKSAPLSLPSSQSLPVQPPVAPLNPPPLGAAPQQVPLQPGLPNMPVKQITSSADRSRQSKKQPPSKEELVTMLDSLLDNMYENKDLEASLKCFKDLKIPNRHRSGLLCQVMMSVISKTDSDRDLGCQLMASAKKDGLFTDINYLDGLSILLEHLPELEVETPLIKSQIASLGAKAVTDEIITLAELAELMENGVCYPLFLLCLQKIAKEKDKEWLLKRFTESKVNMQKMLPEMDQNKERMMDILEDKGLSFLFPLLRLHIDVWKKLTNDPSPSTLYKWIKENVTSDLHEHKTFVNALTMSILKYVTQETTLSPNIDPAILPEKTLQEKEKALLEKFSPVLKKFLHEKPKVQLCALYSLQTHCYNNNFPKGMLLRFFINFYDMEICEEESFMHWKEDITDEFPGKGKALFQVNQWLTWLATAEEEDSEEEED